MRLSRWLAITGAMAAILDVPASNGATATHRSAAEAAAAARRVT
jgi:hypothetical protein